MNRGLPIFRIIKHYAKSVKRVRTQHSRQPVSQPPQQLTMGDDGFQQFATKAERVEKASKEVVDRVTFLKETAATLGHVSLSSKNYLKWNSSLFVMLRPELMLFDEWVFVYTAKPADYMEVLNPEIKEEGHSTQLSLEDDPSLLGLCAVVERSQCVELSFDQISLQNGRPSLVRKSAVFNYMAARVAQHECDKLAGVNLINSPRLLQLFPTEQLRSRTSVQFVESLKKAVAEGQHKQ